MDNSELHGDKHSWKQTNNPTMRVDMSFRDEKQILEKKKDINCLLMRLMQCEIKD